jgi:hypothetical protein
MRGAGVFFGFYWPVGPGVVAFVPRVCPSFAIPPYHCSSSLEQGKYHKFFVCAKSPAVEKNVPSVGALRRALASLGPSAQNLGSKSALPRPWWALDTAGWHRVVGGHIYRLALLL